jgi:hypothetical protein
LRGIKVISNIDKISYIAESGDGRNALKKELDRFHDAINELSDGKRRIYDGKLLYNEQKEIITDVTEALLTIHIVRKLEDLQRWDPQKMDVRSDFYKVLYAAFGAIKDRPM